MKVFSNLLTKMLPYKKDGGLNEVSDHKFSGRRKVKSPLDYLNS